MGTTWSPGDATAGDVQICNLALARVGIPPVVSSIHPPDGSTESRYCSLFYPQALATLIQQHRWNSHLRTEQLTLKEERADRQMRYLYLVPPRTVRVWAIGLPDDYQLSGYIGSDNDPNTNRCTRECSITRLRKWRRWRRIVNPDNQEQLIETTLPDAWIERTTTETAAANFSPLFTEALSWLLASFLAHPLRNEPKLTDSLRAQYGVALDAAKAADAHEGEEGGEQKPPEWIECRQGPDPWRFNGGFEG